MQITGHPAADLSAAEPILNGIQEPVFVSADGSALHHSYSSCENRPVGDQGMVFTILTAKLNVLTPEVLHEIFV